MRSIRTTTTAATTDLPRGVKASDLKSPKIGDLASEVGDWGVLTFYKTQGLGWVIATLKIGGGRNGRDDRTYGVIVETGKQCRVGNGPHVLATVRVYVRQSRVEALKRYIDLYGQGVADSNQIRDRISTRRAQGQLHRAQGRTSWYW